MQIKDIEIVPSSVFGIKELDGKTVVGFLGFSVLLDEPLTTIKALLEESGESFHRIENVYLNKRNIALIKDGKAFLTSGQVI